MKDDWNLKDFVVMRYHHMMEEGFYPEDAVDKLREKLQNELARNELSSKRINELFGAIDTTYMKEFWKKRAEEHVLNEGLTNLEDDSDLLKIKIRDEEDKILPYTNWDGKTVLDLGSGWGSWAFKFVEKGAKKVTCVDYVLKMCMQGVVLAEKNNVKNIEFIHKSVQDFKPSEKYDIIFISGISVHMNDIGLKKMINNIKDFTSKNSIVIVRDGTGVPDRYSFDKEYSERLKTQYSGIYRSREEYISLFEKAGFELVEDENMFPEGHPLNKYPKVRLRLYKFKKL